MNDANRIDAARRIIDAYVGDGAPLLPDATPTRLLAEMRCSSDDDAARAAELEALGDWAIRRAIQRIINQ